MYPTVALPYMGHTVAYNIINWAVLYKNLKKDRRMWVIVEKVMTKAGSAVRAHGMFYKAVI